MPPDTHPSNSGLSYHGVQAFGATVCEVRRDGAKIGHIRKLAGGRFWEWQPDGWTGWTGDYPRVRDAVAALGAAVEVVDDAA